MMLRPVLIIVAIPLLLYLAAVLAMTLLQRQFLYFPTNRAPLPEALGLSDLEVREVTTGDGETIQLWVTPAETGQPTILFLHGNSGEVADRTDRLSAYRAAGFGVVAVSWRGFGGSTGRPTEAGLLADALAAYDWLLAQGVTAQNIAVIGESLGTGIAVQLAAQRPVGAVSLGAPYSAIVDIAADQFPWLPVRLLLVDQFRSVDHIADITAPILIQHGTADRVVPFAAGQALRDAAPVGTSVLPLEGADHDILFQSEIWTNDIAFLRDVFSP